MTTPNLSTNSGTSVQRKWCLGGWSLKMRLPKFWTTTIDPSVRDAMIETYFLCTDEMGGCLSRCQYIWNYIFKDKLHLPIFSPVTKQNTSKSIQRSILKEPIIQFQPYVMETTLKILLTHTHTHTHTHKHIKSLYGLFEISHPVVYWFHIHSLYYTHTLDPQHRYNSVIDMSHYIHGTNHSTHCEPSGMPNAHSHFVWNFVVLSLAWRWLF